VLLNGFFRWRPDNSKREGGEVSSPMATLLPLKKGSNCTI
jgi:hypothetical protein